MRAAYADKHFDLVVECKNGSQQAQFKLYKLYAKAMLNTAYRIVADLDEAQDVLQEAFVDAFGNMANFRHDTTFGLWLKQLVVNRAINALRRRKMHLVEITDDHAEALAHEDEDADFNDHDLEYKVDQVRLAINALPDTYRVVLSLYLLEGYDHQEISEILNISENNSRTQVLRAKRKLIEALKLKGIQA